MLGKVEKYERIRSQLDAERSSFIPYWRDIGTFIKPSRPRFFLGEGNRGDRRNLKIIDSTATYSSRTLASGMMSGITSPSRPWFRLSTPDPSLAESENVKWWLHVVTERMRSVFLKSNYYNTMSVIYGDVGDFGTAAFSIEEDFDKTIRTNTFPIGSYMLAKDFRGKVNTFCREFRMTVRQCVEQFGRKENTTGKIDWSNFSQYIRNAWDNGDYEQWVELVHIIMPNDEHDPERLESKHKKFISVYYERGSGNSTTGSIFSNYSGMSGALDTVLSEKGYDYFPIMAPRWFVSGEDVYGTDCPGMTVLGDVKQLQHGEKRLMQATDKGVNPPVVAHSSLQSKKTSLLPGGVNWVDDMTVAGMRTLHEVNPAFLQYGEAKQQGCRLRIQRGYFEDLFLMLANMDRRDVTATEINQRYEEKLLILGPVLEQMNFDALDPTIEVVFDIMNKQGFIPPPPVELQGQELKVEYVSVMAQAQKLLGLSGIERFTHFVGRIAAMNPEINDKVSFDQMLDVYADAASLAPGIVVSDEEAMAIREQRALMQQQQMQAEQAKLQSSAVRDLAQSKIADDNALKRLMGA